MPETSKDRPVVMVSSTAPDLPEHRKEVMDACLRMGMHPVMLEHLTAGDTTATEESLAMVDDAAIYLGVLAYRYGHVPETNNPAQISITEMEYDRAVERGIPRLIFLMDKSHPLTAADMEEETDDPAELGLGYKLSGQLRRATALYLRVSTMYSEMKNDVSLSVSLCNLSNALWLAGALCKAEAATRRALVITREQNDHLHEALSTFLLGLKLAARGLTNESRVALQRALRMYIVRSNSQFAGVVNFLLAWRALWLGDFAGAISFANRAWELAQV